jgi:hypothetical protein
VPRDRIERLTGGFATRVRGMAKARKEQCRTLEQQPECGGCARGPTAAAVSFRTARESVVQAAHAQRDLAARDLRECELEVQRLVLPIEQRGESHDLRGERVARPQNTPPQSAAALTSHHLACDLPRYGGTDAEPRRIYPRGIPRPGQRGVHSSGWLVA